MMKNLLRKIKKLFSKLLGKKEKQEESNMWIDPNESCYTDEVIVDKDGDGKLVHFKFIKLEDLSSLRSSGCKNWDEYKKQQEEFKYKQKDIHQNRPSINILIKDSEFNEIPENYLYEDNRDKFLRDVGSLKDKWFCKVWTSAFDFHNFIDIESLSYYLANTDHTAIFVSLLKRNI